MTTEDQEHRAEEAIERVITHQPYRFEDDDPDDCEYSSDRDDERHEPSTKAQALYELHRDTVADIEGTGDEVEYEDLPEAQQAGWEVVAEQIRNSAEDALNESAESEAMGLLAVTLRNIDRSRPLPNVDAVCEAIQENPGKDGLVLAMAMLARIIEGR